MDAEGRSTVSGRRETSADVSSAAVRRLRVRSYQHGTSRGAPRATGTGPPTWVLVP